MVIAPAAQPPAPADKKQKQKVPSTDIRPDSAEKKRKRKEQHGGADTSEQGATNATQVVESSDRPEKRQKNEQRISESEDQPVTGPEGTSPKKPKREKRPKKPKDKSKGRKEEAPNPKDTIQIIDVPIPYTNPLTDEALPDFAQRGLAYAYQYAQHISLTSESERAEKRAWKFNKARQNWILRNITDADTIPDSYLPISLIYITSIQGGARDELRKICKRIKKQAKTSKTVSNDQAEPKPEVNQASGESSKKVAFAVGTAEPATVEPEIPAPSKVKVKRAKTILKVLKGKIQPQDI